jgi:hypothetical protein
MDGYAGPHKRLSASSHRTFLTLMLPRCPPPSPAPASLSLSVSRTLLAKKMHTHPPPLCRESICEYSLAKNISN